MRIIISPAKQMRVDTDSFTCTELPVYTDRAEILKDWIRSLSYEEQKRLWACNDKIARQNAERFWTAWFRIVWKCRQRQRSTAIRICMISGATACIGKSWMKVVSSSIWLRRNIRNALRSISSRRTVILPASLVSLRAVVSSKKAFTPRCPVVKWSGLWPVFMQKSRSRSKLLTGAAIILTKTALPLMNMSLSGQRFPGSRRGGDYI